MAASIGNSSAYIETSSTTTMTRTINVTAGSALAVFAGDNNTSRTFPSCTDSQSNTYTTGPTATGLSARKIVSWRAVAASTGSLTVTVTISAADSNCWMAAIEVPGGTFSLGDAQSNATGATTHYCAASPGVTVPDDSVVVAALSDWSASPGTVTQASGYTAIANSGTASPPSLVQARAFTTGTTNHRADITSTSSVAAGGVLMLFTPTPDPPESTAQVIGGGWFGL